MRREALSEMVSRNGRLLYRGMSAAGLMWRWRTIARAPWRFRGSFAAIRGAGVVDELHFLQQAAFRGSSALQSQRGPVGRERRAGGRAIVSVFTVKVAGVGGSQAVPASDFEGIEVNFLQRLFLARSRLGVTPWVRGASVQSPDACGSTVDDADKFGSEFRFAILEQALFRFFRGKPGGLAVRFLGGSSRVTSQR